MDTNMDTNREKLYLAALLHDIGKFYQRADPKSASKSVLLDDKNRTPSSYCPLNPRKCRNKKWYTHKHVLWTAQFIDDSVDVFQNLPDAVIADNRASNMAGADQPFDNHSPQKLSENLKDLAAGHHLDRGQISDLGCIIKEADCLSSGMDRDNIKDGAFMDERNYFKRKRMVPIFQTIGQDSSFRQWNQLDVTPLKLSKAFFPKEKKDLDPQPDYASLWDSFVKEFGKIQSSDYRSVSETLLSLLLKYTSCIPASTINFSDVSLYDHLKTTAAISVCLYDFDNSEDNPKPDKPFLLIGADFSGIQSYIYQIVSKYAGKNLKGRSFYLSLLSDAVVRYLLKEMQLFQANVVFNSGGSFYLLAPNIEFTRTKLKQCIQTIEKKLFKAHGTSLFLAIDSLELSKDVLYHKNGQHFGQVWGELYEKCEKKKSAKYATQISSNYKLFEPHFQGGNAERDSITGEEFLSEEKPIEKEGLKLKKTTAKQIEIGKKLRETKRIVVAEKPIQGLKGRTCISPADLGFIYYFLDSENDLKQLKPSDKNVTVVTLNGTGTEGNCDFMPKEDCGNIYSPVFYGGNEFNGATFNEMCENNNFSRMGVLRMDVDDLGKAFRKGIAPERATISRFSTLSRSIDFFFSGYLNTIWREIDRDRSFIIYCGGDDVFVVGSWDVMIMFAKRIRDDFMEYVCGNPAFTLSGGIAIVHPKFPIMKGADESALEEERAKNHNCKDNNKDYLKNSISFMGMPLNWEHEFPAVEELKTNLVEWLKKGQLPKSILSKVLSHYENAEMKNHQIRKMKTYWMLTYDLSRQKSKSNLDSINGMIDNCIKEVCDNNKGKLNGEPILTNYHPLELWAFAARWAELEYRSKNNQ